MFLQCRKNSNFCNKKCNTMGWLSKIFKGSSHRISEGQYLGKSSNDGTWCEPTISLASSGYESEDIDHAIALSLLEEEQKKTKTIEPEPNLVEDEQLARALQESLNTDSPPRQNRSSPPRQNGAFIVHHHFSFP
ncbi:hypothetical protein HPP92_017752 [Vanilla planifolia]|uniref:Uncharacterized protein n=1 Tax=Vanilla planifolia TaxID=51239 RepID=A0A835QBH4_VANPL|nr:hypothetical protein HPP92_028658 [Vanilla planifolia]KAG0466172.1 hypothetical protein HPP92_017752 [Vanilla planifolia]